ncbi:MAG: hypothetical protein HC767_14530 [Akkermansiaceae bacterium]|nr:hypothetical protein [Akkermansiaceae bacterium]
MLLKRLVPTEHYYAHDDWDRRTENVDLTFTTDAIDALADFAFRVNQSTQNIGARRLHTILEKVLEEISFHAPDPSVVKLEVTANYVRDKLAKIAEDEDLSRFIL